MYVYRCIVTSNIFEFSFFFSLRIAPYWNFEIMTISLPIKTAMNSAFMS